MSSSYTKEILRLAMEAGDFPRLSNPTVSGEHRAPLCGSRIVIDLMLDDDGAIIDIGFELSACAFGQASSVLFARHAVGLGVEHFSVTADAIKSWLLGAGPSPMQGFDDLAPVKPLTARHGAILLPFEAAFLAMSKVPAR